MKEVVVTNAGSTTAIALIRSLGKHRIPLVASDFIPNSVGFMSRYCNQHFLYNNPYQSPMKSLETLVKMGKNLGNPVLMPAGDDVILLAAKYRSALDSAFILPLPPNDTLRVAVDKELTLNLASKIGVPTPRTFTPSSLDQLKDLKNEIKYPIIVKPRITSGFRNKFGQKIIKVWSFKQLTETYMLVDKFFPRPLIQEYIPGGVQNLCSLCTVFDQKHNALGIFAIKKLHQLIEGVTACGEFIEDANITDFSMRILKALRWIGPAELEFKRDARDSTFKLMEINPRPFMWMNLPISAGFDIPYLWYKIAVGETYEKIVALKKGFRFINLFHHLLGLIDELSYGENKKQATKNFLKALKGHFVFDLLSSDDMLPFLSYPILFLTQRLQESLSRK